MQPAAVRLIAEPLIADFYADTASQPTAAHTHEPTPWPPYATPPPAFYLRHATPQRR